MDFLSSMNVSAAGMQAQTARMRVAAENIANADSVESADGSGAYRTHIVNFKTMLDRHTGVTGVQVSGVSKDMATPLVPVYEPGNPLADAKGFVMHPNVDTTVENINLKEAQRSYEANMTAYTTARSMATRTLDMMR